MRRHLLPVVLAATALTIAPAGPAAALGPPEGDGAVVDLGPLGEVGDVTTAGQAVGLGTGKPDADDPTREYVLDTALPLDPVQAESIAYDPDSDSFFTASFVNGAVYKGSLSEDEAPQFLAPLAGARSMRLGVEVDDGRLFVVSAAQGTVDVFDTETAEQLATFDTGLGGVLNDLVVDPAGDLYVTDSVRSSVFRVSAEELAAGEGEVEEISLAPELAFTVGPRVNGLFNANGIVATAPGELVISKTNTDELFRLEVGEDPEQRTVTPIELDQAVPSADGVELVGDRLFVMDNLGNAINEVELDDDGTTGRVVGRTTDPTFSTATGIASTGERLLISNSQIFTVPMVVPATVSSIPLPTRAAATPTPTPTATPTATPQPAATPRSEDQAALPRSTGGGLAATGAAPTGALAVAAVAAGLLVRRRRA